MAEQKKNEDSLPQLDFFISYTNRDVRWAEWIAWQLKDAGYSVMIQAWHFRPGNSFIRLMKEASEKAYHVLAVITPKYFESEFAESEWASAFSKDPTGRHRKLIPVRVEDFKPPGLLAPIVYIDLVGKSEKEAREVLLRGLEEDATPTRPPSYPGGPGRTSNAPRESAPSFPGSRTESGVPADSGEEKNSSSNGQRQKKHINKKVLLGAAIAAVVLISFIWLLAYEHDGKFDNQNVFQYDCGASPTGKGGDMCGIQHSSSKLFLDRTEVTVAEFGKCVEAGVCPSEGLSLPKAKMELSSRSWLCNWNQKDRLDHPINCVSWDASNSYCTWAGKRLPTATEWVLGARRNRITRYPWGNRDIFGVKNSEGNPPNIADLSLKEEYPDLAEYADGSGEYDDGFPITSPVGAANLDVSPWGLMDMAGNVWEWTAEDDDKINAKIIKGGSWYNGKRQSEVSHRNSVAGYRRLTNLGFRCALSDSRAEVIALISAIDSARVSSSVSEYYSHFSDPLECFYNEPFKSLESVEAMRKVGTVNKKRSLNNKFVHFLVLEEDMAVVMTQNQEPGVDMRDLPSGKIMKLAKKEGIWKIVAEASKEENACFGGVKYWESFPSNIWYSGKTI